MEQLRGNSKHTQVVGAVRRAEIGACVLNPTPAEAEAENHEF